MKKGMMALIGMVLTLVFIIIAFIGPWYSVASIDIGLTTEAASGFSRGTLDTTMYIAILALVFSIIALIGALGVSFGFGNANTMGKIGGIFGLLTFVFALIAPIYFMTLEEFSVLGGFWNDFGGPGYGWYIMIIAAIIALMFSLPMFKKQAA